MIVQVRGTSGSGKSTVVRAVMAAAGEWEAVHVEGRKRPLFYRHRSRRLYVPGHYESPCGGCDTVGSARAVYDLIKAHFPDGDVLCEGLLLSEDVKWTTSLHEEQYALRVLFLTTPLERCLRQIGGRRAEAGNEKPLDPANTENRVRTIDRARLRLTEAGVDCRRCTPEQAPGMILRWLGCTLAEGVTK